MTVLGERVAGSKGAAADTSHTPRSDATDSTAVLEEKLRKRKDAKRPQPEEEGDDPRNNEGWSKQQRTRPHKHEEDRHSGRDTRRSRRTSKEDSDILGRYLG